MLKDILDGLMLHTLLPVTKTFGVFIFSGFDHPLPEIRVYSLTQQSGALKLDIDAVTLDEFLVQFGHVDVFMLPCMGQLMHESGKHARSRSSAFDPYHSVLQIIEAHYAASRSHAACFSDRIGSLKAYLNTLWQSYLVFALQSVIRLCEQLVYLLTLCSAMLFTVRADNTTSVKWNSSK